MSGEDEDISIDDEDDGYITTTTTTTTTATSSFNQLQQQEQPDDDEEVDYELDEDDDDQDMQIPPFSTSREDDDDQDNPYSTMSFTATNNTVSNRMNLLYSDNNVSLVQPIDVQQQQQQQMQQMQQQHQQHNNPNSQRLNLLYSDANIGTVNGSLNDSSNGSTVQHHQQQHHQHSIDPNQRMQQLLYSDASVMNSSYGSLQVDQQQQQQSYENRMNLLYSDANISTIHSSSSSIQQQPRHNNNNNHNGGDIEMKDSSSIPLQYSTSSATSLQDSTPSLPTSSVNIKPSAKPTDKQKIKKSSSSSSVSSSSSKKTTTKSPSPPGITSPNITAGDETIIVDSNQEKSPSHEFSYDINALTWDIDHLENKENRYCYCGNGSDQHMIRCDYCLQRFHIGCIKILGGSSQMQGDWVYRFTCSICSNGNESLERFSKNMVDILEIVIYHLQQQNPSQRYFSFDNDIVPVIDENWYILWNDKKKKANWQKPLLTALSNGRIFKSGAINIKKQGYWALGMNQLLLKDNPIFKDKVLAPLHRKKKKKKSTGEEIRFKHLSTLFLIPLKEGNYVPMVEYDIMCIAAQNSAPQITIESDLLTVRNMSGYRMTKASFPCIYGNWYFEIQVLNNEGACRLGWSAFRGDKQANVGYDQFSYGYRSQGDIFHKARGKSYGEKYQAGDTLGFYISLPSQNLHKTNNNNNNHHQQETTDISKIIFTDKTDQVEIYERVAEELETDTPAVLENSEIRFFKNGVSPGVAFTGLGRGMYYPAASMYMGAQVRFNFGPDFKYPPQGGLSFRPMSDVVNIIPK
ncbi:hypothetical protein DFA_05996 [Cavenderia fasciculata]|uniref:B30.2/SPRY domain-containing protein n=1 Tax=Cavenderia fasciculata TaxID=261658 RepID=F4PJT6_CACFS|nr:uncharacterized protein DFA_05996 [Cavenderia fasciculata]EGG23860.1 hypothetical protein DFA_05996 [Cavenderia fasciculata]|eukprot:XP_004361711.1 hypothetical protein DFA_05996 [Cavenderia fasciculata]